MTKSKRTLNRVAVFCIFFTAFVIFDKYVALPCFDGMLFNQTSLNRMFLAERRLTESRSTKSMMLSVNESPFRRSISGLGLLRQFSVDFGWSLAAWLKGWRAAGEKMKQHGWDFCFRWRVAFNSWLKEKQEGDKEESAEHWERDLDWIRELVR